MKIRKTLFSMEIEITPEEINEFYNRVPTSAFAGLVGWLRKNFDLDLVKEIKNKV